ncbi:hypothetical protein BDV97DRAFT_396670 [Delphinella strobiligena]|nr:hypothetical protein BDV97DRAFT_396670 [Delphinella strobiligena]
MGRETVKEVVAIPEPFCWYVLGELAKAALEMQNPAQIKLQYPDLKNPQIIHHDTKPANVFVGPRRDDYFPAYPSLKLGDFGLAQETWQTDTSDPIMSTYDKPFMPMEFIPNSGERHTQASNVCQIGLIVQYMMLRAEDRGIGGNRRSMPKGLGGVHVKDGAFRVEPIIPIRRPAYNDDDDDEDLKDWPPGTRLEDINPIIEGMKKKEKVPAHRKTLLLQSKARNYNQYDQEVIDACNPTSNKHIKGMHDIVEAVKPSSAPYWLFSPEVEEPLALGSVWQPKDENAQYDTPSEEDQFDDDDEDDGELMELS